MTDGNEKFEQKARALLTESDDNLDAATLSRLHQARNHAMSNTATNRSPVYWWAGSSALAAGILTFGIYLNQIPPLPDIYEDPLQQATAENMELLDDLDFIAWLVLEESEQNVNASS